MDVLRTGLAVGLLGSLLVGCQNKVADENKRLWTQNRELQSELTETRERLKSSPDPGQIQSMQQELAARDAKIKELESSLRQPSQGHGTWHRGDRNIVRSQARRDDRQSARRRAVRLGQGHAEGIRQGHAQ
jgi:hypothetical protein